MIADTWAAGLSRSVGHVPAVVTDITVFVVIGVKLIGIGDACEDNDLDGILNLDDNCPNIPNAEQDDTDGVVVFGSPWEAIASSIAVRRRND